MGLSNRKGSSPHAASSYKCLIAAPQPNKRLRYFCLTIRCMVWSLQRWSLDTNDVLLHISWISHLWHWMSQSPPKLVPNSECGKASSPLSTFTGQLARHAKHVRHRALAGVLACTPWATGLIKSGYGGCCTHRAWTLCHHRQRMMKLCDHGSIRRKTHQCMYIKPRGAMVE